MKRVLILGCCGAGKSTFAKALHNITQLEVIHLDQYYWKPNWVESEKEEWKKVVQQLAQKPEWIMDGNYGSTLDMRITRADTILYLDCPTWKCLWRIVSRTIKFWGTERPDMPIGCKERFDLDFFHYVAVFNLVRRKNLLKKITAVKGEKRVEILANEQALKAFLKESGLA